MVGDSSGTTFGLWYDSRQRSPLEDYAGFHAECLEESLFATEVIPRVHEAAGTKPA